MSELVPSVSPPIYHVRGVSVVLDEDVAALFDVTTKALNQAVRRNAERFPEEFSFLLTQEEWRNLRSQIVTSSGEHGGRRYAPTVFSEHGVVMLAGILNSPRAVAASLAIVREFVRLRQAAREYGELSRRIDALEGTMTDELRAVWETLRALVQTPSSPDRRMGLRQDAG